MSLLSRFNCGNRLLLKYRKCSTTPTERQSAGLIRRGTPVFRSRQPLSEIDKLYLPQFSSGICALMHLLLSLFSPGYCLHIADSTISWPAACHFTLNSQSNYPWWNRTTHKEGGHPMREQWILFLSTFFSSWEKLIYFLNLIF